MKNSVRHTLFVAATIAPLGGLAALAASPSDPAAIRSPAPVADTAKVKAPPGAEKTMAAAIEQRITDLHAKLQITKAQQPQWDQFTRIMRENARGTDQTFQQRIQTMPTMSAVDNMKSYAQVVMVHAQDVRKLVPAFQDLYASMSESQKRTADQVFRNDAHQGEPTKRG